MRRVGWHRLQRLRHDLGDFLVSDLARRAAARFVIEPSKRRAANRLRHVKTVILEAPTSSAIAQLFKTIGRQKHNFGPHRIGPRGLATPYPCFQLEALLLAEDDLYRRRSSHGSLRIISTQRSNHDTAKMPRNF
jgi:hypothetical protein